MTGYSQRWRARRHSWRHIQEGDAFESWRYEVAWVDQATAEAFIIQHHYSRRMPGRKTQWGLFERDQLVGVLALSTPMQASVLTNPFPDLVPYYESAELGRLVLLPSVPANGESWFVGQCFHEAERAGFRGIVSFADPVERVLEDGTVLLPGHAGTIYQALSGIPAGRGSAGTLRMFRDDGTIFNERAIQKIRKQESRHEAAEALLVARGMPPLQPGEDPRAWVAGGIRRYTVPLKHPGNWRYLFTLGNSREKRSLQQAIPLRRYLGVPEGGALAPLHTYYPKRQPLVGQVAA